MSTRSGTPGVSTSMVGMSEAIEALRFSITLVDWQPPDPSVTFSTPAISSCSSFGSFGLKDLRAGSMSVFPNGLLSAFGFTVILSSSAPT